MAESYLEKRRRELGLSSSAAPTASAPKAQSNYVEKRKQELGLVPTPKPEPAFEPLPVDVGRSTLAQKASASIPAPEPTPPPPSVDVRKSPVIEEANNMPELPRFQQQRRQAEQLPVVGGLFKALGALGRPSEIVSEFTQPEAPVIEAGRNVPGTSARESFMDRTQQEPAKGAAKLLGQVAAPFAVPGAGLGAGVELYRGVGQALAPVAPRLGQGLGGRVAQEAIREAAVGIPMAAGVELSQGKSNLQDAAVQGAIGGLAGGGIGAAIPAVGAGARAVANSAIERYLGPVLQSVTQRGRTPQEAAIEQIYRASQIPDRLTPLSNNQALNRVMEQIRPIVDQRLTPPLENESELAKYVQRGLQDRGADISLNEVRAVGYDGLREMAEELRSTANIYDEAVRAARDKGYNLSELLEGRSPSQMLRDRVQRDASARVAGVYPEAALPVQRPLLPETPQPAKQDWFGKLFGNQGVGFTPGAKDAKAVIDTHITDRSIARGSLLERARSTAEGINDRLIDQYTPLKEISDEAYVSGIDTSRANNLANIAVQDKLVDLEGNVIGQSLREVFDVVPRGQQYMANRYLVLRDSIDRMRRGQNVWKEDPSMPQTPEAAEDMVRQLEAQNPWLRQVGENTNAFNQARQQLWVDSGIASPQLVERLRTSNPNYTPMFRQMDETSRATRMGGLNTSKRGLSNQKAPVKKATGSRRKIVDPVQGWIETTGSSYNAMLRNRALQKVHDSVLADPERFRGLVEIVEESADAKATQVADINRILDEEGLDGVADYLNAEAAEAYKKAKQSTTGSDNVVTVLVDGEPVKMRVYDMGLLRTIQGMAPEQLGPVLGAIDMISRGIKHAATGGAAPLQGAMLAFRDLPVAFTQSKDKLRFFQDVTQALVSQIADWLPTYVPGAERLGNLARQYYRAGGGYERHLKGDSRLRNVSADITKDPILTSRNAVKMIRRYNPFRPLKGFGDALENIPRIAAFNAHMRRTGWDRSEANVRQAINEAREATVNWSRRGSHGRSIEAVLPYSNAAIQGSYRFFKRMKEQPVAAVGLIMALAGAKIAAFERFKDDQDYQQRSRFSKGIPVGKTADGKFRTVPVEPTDSFIADQVLEFYKWATGQQGTDGYDAKRSIQDAADAFLPKYGAGPISTFTSPGKAVDIPGAIGTITGGSTIEPFSAVTFGKNFFGGDIVPREYQDLPTELQFNETTSAAGKWAAEHLGMNAFVFDYLAERFGGDLAKVGLPMTSAVGKGDPTGNTWDETLARLKLLEDPVMKNRISEDFYSRARAVTEAKASNDKQDVPLPDWYDAAYDEVTSTRKDSIARRVSDLNKVKKEIERDLTLNAKQRADELRSVQSEINMLRLEGIRRMEELGVPKTK